MIENSFVKGKEGTWERDQDPEEPGEPWDPGRGPGEETLHQNDQEVCPRRTRFVMYSCAFCTLCSKFIVYER